MSLYYQDENVTLYHGDCLEHPDWWTSANVLVTDPPYGVKWSGIAKAMSAENRKVFQQSRQIHGDDSLQVRDEALKLWGIKKPMIVFGSWKQPRPENTKFRLIWWKRGMRMNFAKAAFFTEDEEIYVAGKGFINTAPPAKSVFPTDESRATEVKRIGHPTPKPLPLMEWLLGRCQPTWVIADPFAGSGSTLIAAKALGRKAIGIELEEKYCEITATRLSQEILDLKA